METRPYCYSLDLGLTIIHAEGCPNSGRPDVGNQDCISVR